jgi:hypothetical protein
VSSFILSTFATSRNQTIECTRAIKSKAHSANRSGVDSVTRRASARRFQHERTAQTTKTSASSEPLAIHSIPPSLRPSRPSLVARFSHNRRFPPSYAHQAILLILSNLSSLASVASLTIIMIHINHLAFQESSSLPQSSILSQSSPQSSGFPESFLLPASLMSIVSTSPPLYPEASLFVAPPP